MNLGQSIRSGVRWLLIGNTGNHVYQFAIGVVLARLLVPADFGMVVTIQVFTGFVGMLASAGMGQSLIRAKEATAEDFEVVFTLQLSLGVFIYLGFFVMAPWLASFLNDPLYADLLRVSALSFLLRPFAFVRTAWLNREMQFKKAALAGLATGALSGPASILMAMADMGVWSLILGGLVSALLGNILLACVTPLRPRLRFQSSIAQKHGAYGLKITVTDFLTYITEQTTNLILSKMAGPSFLGLFNKAESLARAPSRLITPPTGQTLFRAMSKIQDDLDQTKYLMYRAITLLMVYISPALVMLWFVAEAFVGAVYGEKWLPAVEPLRILLALGILRIIGTPCGVLLAAQNRLNQEIVRQTLGFLIVIPACLIGLQFGLLGVAWSMVAIGVFLTLYGYAIVCRTISTHIGDLAKALVPGLILNVPLVVVLALVHLAMADVAKSSPIAYLLAMALSGSSTYAVAFLFAPIPALRSEAARWRRAIRMGMRLVHHPT
jgi:teichuronic acid exporter